MAGEELPYELQLEEKATRVNQFWDDGISPETFLSPTFLWYFPMAMDPGVLTGIKWNDVTGMFVWSPTL